MSHQHPYGPPPSYQGQFMPPGYAPLAVWTCRHCGAQESKIYKTKISTGGWILFAVLLFVCLPACWIPLIAMKDHLAMCGRCNTFV